jgi:nucleoredoxin
MLRAGYSSATVMQELAKRRFIDTLDMDKEGALVKAGATPDLVAALKSGNYAVSADEVGAAQAQIDKRIERNAVDNDRLRKSNALFQTQVAQERNAKVLKPSAGSVIHDAVKGDLVRYSNGGVTKADPDGLANKKLIAIYFSAQWCGPCRKFTPELVSFYNRVASQHPEFEVLFYSVDRSAFAMQNYMRDMNMPWLAIDYGKLEDKEAVRKYAGSGVPCLVLVDAAGKVISDSYAGTNYLGPAKVLADLDAILSGNGGPVAQRR